MDEEKKKKLALYAGAAASVALVVLALWKKNGTSSTVSDSSGTSQAPIVVSGGGGDNSALLQSVKESLNAQSDSFTAGLKTLSENQQALAGEIAQVGAASTAQANQMSETLAAQKGQLSSAIASLANATSGLQGQVNSVSSNLQQQSASISQIAASRNVSTSIPAPTYTSPVQPTQYTFFGAPTDIASAMQVFSGSQYHFVDTSGMSDSQKRSAISGTSNAIVVGGINAGGGVSQDTVSGLSVVRVAGYDAAATRAALQNLHL